jgi:hypothetical protein
VAFLVSFPLLGLRTAIEHVEAPHPLPAPGPGRARAAVAGRARHAPLIGSRRLPIVLVVVLVVVQADLLVAREPCGNGRLLAAALALLSLVVAADGSLPGSGSGGGLAFRSPGGLAFRSPVRLVPGVFLRPIGHPQPLHLTPVLCAMGWAQNIRLLDRSSLFSLFALHCLLARAATSCIWSW